MARKPVELIITAVIQACVTASLFYLFRRYGLPVMIIGSLLGCIIILVPTVQRFNSLSLAKKIGSASSAFSLLILSVLFGIKYYVADIKITQLHVGILVLAPLLIMQYLDKREKKTDSK